jgi:hypothetical protein
MIDIYGDLQKTIIRLLGNSDTDVVLKGIDYLRSSLEYIFQYPANKDLFDGYSYISIYK